MIFFSSSFGKQPLGTNGKRGTDCLVLEYSELIVVGQISLQLALHVDTISPWGWYSVNLSVALCPLVHWNFYFTITAQILVHSLANFVVNRWTDTRIYNLCDAATSESGQFDSLLSQKSNGCQYFVIILSKLSADPLGYCIVDPQLLWRCHTYANKTSMLQSHLWVSIFSLEHQVKNPVQE